jgi:transposase InsO family protein
LAETDLVIQALRSAVMRRNPGKGLIHHSDKGSQYTSYLFQTELNNQNMRPSFTGTGACLDNAMIESFWASSLAQPNGNAQKRTLLPNPFQILPLWNEQDWAA